MRLTCKLGVDTAMHCSACTARGAPLQTAPSTCYGIKEQQNLHIDIFSSLNKGNDAKVNRQLQNLKWPKNAKMNLKSKNLKWPKKAKVNRKLKNHVIDAH
ncbi:hypothetical protein LINGRAPRIM_LOCUS2881 [Linum grandiflorum]